VIDDHACYRAFPCQNVREISQFPHLYTSMEIMLWQLRELIRKRAIISGRQIGSARVVRSSYNVHPISQRNRNLMILFCAQDKTDQVSLPLSPSHCLFLIPSRPSTRPVARELEKCNGRYLVVARCIQAVVAAVGRKGRDRG